MVSYLMLAVLGLLLIVNTFSVMQGRFVSAIPLILQATVLVLLIRGLRGALWLTRIWSALLIVAGVFYWVSVVAQVLAWAVFPEGGPIQERVTRLTTREAFVETVMLAFGAVFFWRARAIVEVLRNVAKGDATPN